MTRTLRIILAGFAALLIVAFVGLVVLNGTYYGRERVRRAALDAVRNLVHGEVVVGRIDGNLLDRFDLIDVSITDDDEQAFLTAERIRARVALAPLLSKRIIITSIEFERPVITLTRPPGGDWNYKRIFASSDTSTDVRFGWGSWVDLHDVTVREGTVFIHQPFPGDEPLTKSVRDGVSRDDLVRDTRLRVERSGSGLRQSMEFRDINARIPRLVWADPDSAAVAFRVRQLNMLAAVLRAPDVVVRDFAGDVRVGEDTVIVRNADLRLPASEIKGAVTYLSSAGDVELDLESDTLALADLRVIYPDLPDRGGGRLDLKAVIRDTATSVYQFSNARLAVDRSRVSGVFGIAVSPESFELRETDLRFTRFATNLLERVVPDLHVKVPGDFTGTAKLKGPPSGMRADVSGTYDPDRHAPFQVAAHGVVGTGNSIIARNLRLTMRNAPVTLAREFGRDLPLGGTVNADAVISGSTSSTLTGTATVTHRDNGNASTIVADGSVAPGDSMRMQLDLRLTPVSLEVVERFAPRVDLRGNAYGFGELRGTPHDLRAELALDLPEGTVDVDGTFDLGSDVPSYRATVETHNVDLHALAPKLLATSLTGMTTIVGRGADARTVDARLTMHMVDAMIDSTSVPEAIVVATARDARVTVDSMFLRTPFAVAAATGTFGLVEGTEGTLNYTIDVNTISGLQRWINTRDTSLVYPRPLATQRASAVRAREDSIRRATTDSAIAVLASRRKGQKAVAPPLPLAEVPGALPRDSIAGKVSVRGTVKGGVQRFTAQGRAALTQLIWDGSEIGRGTLDFTWADVRTPDVLLTAELGVDSVRAAGFAFDSTHVKATYNDGKGDVALVIFPGDTAEYRLRARYALRADEGEVRLQEINLRFDSTGWTSTRESTVRWRGGGLEIDSLELRSDPRGGGRIFVNGEVPDRDPGRFEVRIDSLRMAPWLTLLQSNLPVDGVATLNATMEGTRQAPRIRGSLAVQRHIYGGVPFPDIRSDFSYADRRLQFEGNLQRTAGTPLAHLKGDLPIDLSFGDSVPKRIYDGPVSIDLEGDSIPLGPLGELAERIVVFTGEARGKVGVRGTWNEPRFEGAIAVNMPSVAVRPSGVTYTSTFARVHMAENRLVIDTLGARSGPKGFIRATGSVVLEALDHPVLDLRVFATEARVLDNARGQLVMSSQVALKGPVDTLDVDGNMTITHGIIRIPDPEQWHLINTGDPALFAVVDTALARELRVAPPSPFMKNANVNVRLKVNRGTWARSREANVEVYGDLMLERATGDEEFSVKGALFSDYGDYDLYGRRFSVTRGSVRFTGPPANPVLQLIAMHQVRQAGRAPFDIQVTIGGTLERPNVSLESQAQPTLTQSDLISFLAFGQSSTSLLQFDGSGVEGGGNSGSSLAGNVAALATRQLAGVAFGAVLAELESDITEKTAFDVVHIRPAELPPGLSLSGVRQVALGTQVEIGKYLDRNTFFYGTFRPTFALPGATIERRFGTQFRARASLEPRYLPQVPSLTSGLQPRVQQVIGALLFWTRAW